MASDYLFSSLVKWNFFFRTFEHTKPGYRATRDINMCMHTCFNYSMSPIAVRGGEGK